MRIRVVGDPFSISGYSKHCREVMLALIRAGNNVSLQLRQMDKIGAGEFSGRKILEETVGVDNNPQASLQIMCPIFFEKVSPVNVGMFFYEADRLPSAWVEKCNQMDCIIAPSEFCREVYERSGVTVPVRVAHGVFTPLLPTTEAPSIVESSGADPGSFKFFSVFQWGYRKGWDVLLRAYWSEFTREDNVALIIKTHGVDISDRSNQLLIGNIRDLKVACGLMAPDGKSVVYSPPVFLVFTGLSDSELARAYAETDCFVLPTRGEGWGRPYMEAASFEKPVIATDWSAHTEFLNNDNAYLIRSELEPCIYGAHDYYPITSNYAAPSIGHLRQLMREVFASGDPKTTKRDDAFQYTEARCASEYVNAMKSVTKGSNQ